MGADLARRRRSRAAGRVHHQRRARADVDRRRARRSVRDAISAPTGSSATTTRRSGTRVLAIPDDELWAVRQSLRRYLFTFVRERARQRWTEEHVGIAARRRRRHAARARCADDRLRAPLHRLQAAGADLPRSRAARAHPERDRTAGADHLRRQVAPGRRHRQAPSAARLQARARSAVRRPRRVRRRLRSARRALPRAGLRRLAEQPAQAARSERHERHEGGDQRRAAPEHRRRLVGRRLQRHATAG